MIEKNLLYLLIIIIVILIMTDPSHALAVPMRRGKSESIPPFKSLKSIQQMNQIHQTHLIFPLGY